MDPIPDILVKENIFEAIKNLIDDIDDIFARTGFYICPLILVILGLWMLFAYFLFSQFEVLLDNDFLITIIVMVVGFIILGFLNYWSEHLLKKRNNLVDEKIESFNQNHTDLGIQVDWNDNYKLYSTVSRANGRDKNAARYASRNLRLLVKMKISARQLYCHENGIPFEMPMEFQDEIENNIE